MFQSLNKKKSILNTFKGFYNTESIFSYLYFKTQ